MPQIIERDGLKKGEAAVITGAAQGLGRGIALRLAEDGAKVALWDVQKDGVEETAALCREAGAADSMTCLVDVGDETAVKAGAEAVLEAWGTPYGLVNNAGIFSRLTVLETDFETWDRMLRVNVTGCFLCSKAFGPAMIEAGRGAIVNFSSGRALSGAARAVSYGTTKGGVLAFTKGLAMEWAPYGIRVNAIMPGVAETAMPLAATNIEELRSRGSRIPLGRIAQPEYLAAVVAFLLSRDSAYMTGQALGVNGGALTVP
ncbi:MAG: SDR family NAD(P)-dependent oxidoreductase [Proteobacteria bacterium]|nr:SDR family NAD(P)-dependent oxidoreductase [Pseudomonadota bacterium]